MEKIGSHVYHSSFYDKTAQAGKDSGKASGVKNADTSNKKTTTLSTAAQKLLKELQKTYSNMDFIVADYETDEEASSLLSRGISEYSALLTTEELEKMAADESVKKENLKLLDDAVSKLDEMKSRLGDKADDVTRIGIAIGNDGEVSFFAELEKNSEKQRERIEKQRTEKKEEAREAAKKEAVQRVKPDMHNPIGKPSEKRTTVYASTIEELAEKISAVDWNAMKEEGFNPAGQRFDFTV